MTSADDARQVADAAATGYVQVGNTRQVMCRVCGDTGEVTAAVGDLDLTLPCPNCPAGDAA